MYYLRFLLASLGFFLIQCFISLPGLMHNWADLEFTSLITNGENPESNIQSQINIICR